ncbi:MAG: 2-Cys peroxiredoxin [Nitrospirales bacterium]|nr:MAG: 2-Cys peroxiredoxin [Nitrospirales bacterium]
MAKSIPNHKQQRYLCVTLILLFTFITQGAWADGSSTLEKGQTLPNARLVDKNGSHIHLNDFKGRIKILSMVPQLNTPVCDEQTHRFSEKNGGLDKDVEIVTISTNSFDDQAHFSDKADIHNVTFLSDSPDYDFGKTTGLLLPSHGILSRTVVVADQDNVVRYIEYVPMSQLPNFENAYQAARKLVASQGK